MRVLARGITRRRGDGGEEELLRTGIFRRRVTYTPHPSGIPARAGNEPLLLSLFSEGGEGDRSRGSSRLAGPYQEGRGGGGAYLGAQLRVHDR